MNRGGAAAEQPVIVKQLGRGATEGLCSGVLGRLLTEVDMQRALLSTSPILLSALGRYRANRVHSAADAHPLSFGELTHPGLPVIDISIAEAGLYQIQWEMAGRGQPAGQIAGVQQCERTPASVAAWISAVPMALGSAYRRPC